MSVIRKDGTARIKLIAPGQGSSGYYPADVLRRDGPGIFKKQTQVFVNHQTDAEESARPEGSIHDLAGVFESDASYHEAGPEGAGLYADVKIFKAYQPLVEEMAPHIGVSIRASGKIGEALVDGKKTRVVEKLTYGKSCDLVTRAGAGGKFVSLLESARAQLVVDETASTETTTNLQETAPAAISTQAATTATQESTTMAETSITAEKEQSLLESEAKIAKLMRDAAMRDGRDAINLTLGRERLPQVAKDKILAEALRDLPCTAEGTVDLPRLNESVNTAILAELEYITKLTGGNPVRGMNSATVVQESKVDYTANLKEKYMRMGMDEKQAAAAAKGVN